MTRLLTNTKILTRIFFVLLLLSASTLGVGLMARYIINVSDEKTDQMASISSRALQGQRVYAQIQAIIADSRVLYTADNAEEVKTGVAALMKSVDKAIADIDKWQTLVPADRKASFAELRGMINQFLDARRQVAAIAQKDGGAAARAFATNPTNTKIREDVVERIQSSVANNEKAVNDINDEVTILYAEQRWILTLTVAGSIIGSLLIAGFIAIGTITRPIRRMTDTMGVLATGNTAVAVEGAERKDEIGAMAKAVQVFKDNMIAREKAESDITEQRRVAEDQRSARETRERKAIEEISILCDKVVNGDLDTRLNEADKDGFLLTISQRLNGLTGMLQQVTGELAAVTTGMAQGDLTNDIRGDYHGVFGRLKAGVNSMAEKLREIAGELNQSAAAVKDASAEISTGSQDLAQRTESQAASIEETAASMHEITATVKQNADNAQAASQLAAVARDAADKGGIVMGNVVTAMGEIEGSASKISDIVGLIDEIAFQTNLLALNASVEAARAGEAGKGFAVVAQEVRALAQRSADASREIKTLITASNGQVREGGKLVGQAGESLNEIVGAVKKVTDIVSEIAAASREQATGLEQVNTAVGSMDEMTQRNGALVEETSAAAQALSQQASQLAQLVSFFRIGGARKLAQAA